MNLSRYLNTDYELICRPWMVPHPPTDKKFITIVTSSEGHTYVPPEAEDPNCMGVFMHYFPTETPYDSHLKYIKNIYPLHLGNKSKFSPRSSKNIQERKYSVGFVGQLDPYRRVEFHAFTQAVKVRYPDSYIHFYEGWNKGLGEDNYSRLMGDFKIALVPWGSASLTTFRYYEAISSGCILLKCHSYTHRDLKVEDPAGHFDIRDWTDHDRLFYTIDHVLADEYKEYYRIANLRYYNKYLSPAACAEFIMDHLPL